MHTHLRFANQVWMMFVRNSISNFSTIVPASESDRRLANGDIIAPFVIFSSPPPLQLARDARAQKSPIRTRAINKIPIFAPAGEIFPPRPTIFPRPFPFGRNWEKHFPLIFRLIISFPKNIFFSSVPISENRAIQKRYPHVPSTM